MFVVSAKGAKLLRRAFMIKEVLKLAVKAERSSDPTLVLRSICRRRVTGQIVLMVWG